MTRTLDTVRGLKEWAKRKGFELGKIIAEPEKYPQFTTTVATTGLEIVRPEVGPH